MNRLLTLFVALMLSSPAFAGAIAVVDFERAVQETEEGKSAQAKLDAMLQSRRSEVEGMQDTLAKELADYEARLLILSDEARQEEERRILGKQQQFQQKMMQYEQEVQQTYYTLVQDLDEKMRALSETIAREKSYDVVLDRAAVIYVGGQAVDMTDDLILRYNKNNPSSP